METLNYQMDGESVQALRSIIGLECKVMMSSEGAGFESNTVTSLSPLFFQIPTGFIELSNDWYTSPQGHDFHLPIARFIHELNPKDVKVGQLEGVKLFEASKAIEFIEVFRLRSRKAVKENFTDKTKLIYVENPGSNTFEFQDLGKIINFAKKNCQYENTFTFGSEDLLFLSLLSFDSQDAKRNFLR